ncbi:GGDEF domain-containing protein [Photobacterium sp. DNB23_23_1]|uniref:diguanylate cyclase n=1 Tax=Photobacterium pectinilyticum TaxID=2906793 RepID=A0ABT1MV95_9GAMM|nr:sensor domain-containing diguanylate cyclase [Photobacterium sp. ZSDE20]MCQ1056452.1 diguanylate cyclase [Photobacterium sp. ZSDE20]MDD1820587.1 diguanylate cyclase [Photobacterium sp. ZSDE20]
MSFSVQDATLVVVDGSEWKILLTVDNAGINYQSPPIEYQETKIFPFDQVTQAVRLQVATIRELNNTYRLYLPLERRSTIIGCFIADFPQNRVSKQFKAKDFSFLGVLLASELSTSMTDAIIQDKHSSWRIAERELKIRQHEQHSLQKQLQALHDISFRLWRADSLNSMLFTAVDEAKKQLNIDRMAIFLFKPGNRMQGTYGTDVHGNTVNEHYFETEIPDLWFSVNPLQKNEEYLAIEENTPLYHNLMVVGFGWSAYITLWDEDTPIGWIACDNLLSGMPLPTHLHQLLKQFAFIVSQHLVRRQAEEKLIQLNTELELRVAERTQALQQANEKLEKVSREDSLTQVANRRQFDERFFDEWRRAERHSLPISLLIIDVDHFKDYNDSFGHAAGDQCLKMIAATLAPLERRAGALFARYGGEEFVLLLPGQDQHAAQYAAERALEAIRELALPRRTQNSDTTDIVTISIGGCTLTPSDNNSADTFFKLADNALYEAKSCGRNQLFMNNYINDFNHELLP